MTEERKIAVAAEVSRREQISAIVWLILGILQVLTCVGILAGAWNIYSATTHFKASKNALNRQSTTPAIYDASTNNIVIALVINLVLGGVFGAAWCIYDFMIRDYVMNNREAFDRVQ